MIHRTPVRLRPMHLADIPQVVQIDRLSFPTPWPPHSYQYEITQNENSCMFVLCLSEAPPEKRPDGVPRDLRDRSSEPSPDEPSPNERVVGYSGFWFVVDEVHISTIAVHPDWRGRKLGELLLWAMMRQTIRMRADKVTLEVRASNSLAQNLYRKYGFEFARMRRGYYRDNREDAYLMIAHPLNTTYRERLVEYGRQLHHRVALTDDWPARRVERG